ncbi:hypothetical protein Tco_0493534 [Tanacetum coccineum]
MLVWSWLILCSYGTLLIRVVKEIVGRLLEERERSLESYGKGGDDLEWHAVLSFPYLSNHFNWFFLEKLDMVA